MPAPSSQNNNSSSLGKTFVWIAWIIGLALLAFVFQDILDKQWNPNTRPNSEYNTHGKAKVTLAQNKHGHYLVNGAINQQPVTFLLDTGATQVSIPAQVAEQLNLSTYGSYPVQTANGSVTVYRTQIETLTLGNIMLHNVSAHINPGMQANEILLGMSALKQVEFSQVGNQLVLTER